MIRSMEIASVVLILNLPFGYMRSGYKKFSLPWFISVHAGVPMVIALRILAGIGWRLWTFPLFIGAYATGHILGGRFRQWRKRKQR